MPEKQKNPQQVPPCGGCQRLRALEKEFLEEGGSTKRLYRILKQASCRGR